jgi:hypothetical protein
MVERFAMRRSWGTRFLWPMVRGPVFAEIADGHVRIDFGWLGGADIEIANVARLSRIRWPWWAGLGVRLGRSMAAFTSASGQAAGIDLIDAIQVRAPLRWRAQRVIFSVEDVDGFLAAIARERGVPPDALLKSTASR